MVFWGALTELNHTRVTSKRESSLDRVKKPNQHFLLNCLQKRLYVFVNFQVAKNRSNTLITTTSSHTRHPPRTHTHPPYINGISENEVFPGFNPAMEACFLEWEDYPVPGVTYKNNLNPLYHSPFTIFRHMEKHDGVHQVSWLGCKVRCLNKYGLVLEIFENTEHDLCK